jgi:hypothetical protein
MDAPQDIFDHVAKALKSKAWFKKEKWQTSTHFFPVKNPEALTFHVFKPHWFNADRQGIHIETFLSLDGKKRKKSSLTVHLLHHELVPGTSIKRRMLAQPVVDEIYDTVSGWDGYRFRAGKYGLQPFTLVLDGSAADFQKVLEKEVSRLCKGIGPVIDKVLKDLVQK